MQKFENKLFSNPDNQIFLIIRIRIRIMWILIFLKTYPLQINNKTAMETKIYPFPNSMLQRCLNEMMAVMLFSQHWVSSSKTVRTLFLCAPDVWACQDKINQLLRSRYFSRYYLVSYSKCDKSDDGNEKCFQVFKQIRFIL